MNKRKFAALLLLLMLALSGCQLAREEHAPQQPAQDALAGFFITTAALDIPHAAPRLYARAVTPDTGEPLDFVFEGAAGFRCFSAVVSQADEMYRVLISDPGIVGNGMHIRETDSGSSVDFSGTLYLWPREQMDTIYYVNPVYQQEDGQIYCVRGSGVHISAASAPGAAMTTTLTESHQTTVNGEAKTRSASAALSIDTMYRPEKIVILQMDDQGLLLARNEYAPEHLPDCLSPVRAAAFLVCETYAHALDGSPYVTRALLQPGDTALSAFYARSDGVCIPASVPLRWSME